MIVHFALLDKGKVLRYDDSMATLLGFVGLDKGGLVGENTSSLHLTAKGRVVRYAPLSKQYGLCNDDSFILALLLEEENKEGTQLTDAGKEWLTARRHMVEEA